jgi:uncharacterized protein (DUF433 family)
MALTIHNDVAPLRMDENGVVRVGDCKVILDVVIAAFNNGSDPEEIVRGFSTLQLADVYATIAYYLRHRKEVDDYLSVRREEAVRLRQEIEANQPDRANLRAKLLARQAQMELDHASPAKGR